MRYIEKGAVEPKCLAEYKLECEELGVLRPLLYKDFNRTNELRGVLSAEQHEVCCYCQRAVKGFRIEHSYPENGPDKEKSERLQLDYYNLFACCVDSLGCPKNLQHCDVSKGNEVIREFIKEKYCNRYFRYLSTGEIVPNGRFYSLSEYLESDNLSDDERDALEAIRILNLNSPTLKEDREECIDMILSLLGKKSEEEWEAIIDGWLSSGVFPSYIELRVQFIRQYLSCRGK